MKKLIGLIGVACFLIGIAAISAENKGPATIKIDTNSKGKAVEAFPHQKHLELGDLKDKCATCHHKDKAGEKPAKCGTCHTSPNDKDAKTGANGFMKAYHKACQDCHKKATDKPALKECKTCHTK